MTLDGTDPLLSAKENCSTLVSLPTEEEKNTAITGNMGRIMAVVGLSSCLTILVPNSLQMKAVNKFKALITRRRPDLIEGVLGRASQFVQPPLSISKTRDDAKAFFDRRVRGEIPQQPHASRSLHPMNEHDNGLADDGQQVQYLAMSARDSSSSQRDNGTRQQESHAAKQTSSSAQEAPDSTDDFAEDDITDDDTHPKRQPSKHRHKGHAHDPLEDHLYLRIGVHAPETDIGDESDDNDNIFAVSESPPAAEVDIFPKAYQAEVDRIQREGGQDTVVYLTRRVEHSVYDGSMPGQREPKKRLAGLLRRAAA